MKSAGTPQEQGLYDPRFEHDACGVGFVCDISGVASNRVVKDGLEVLRKLAHRGATGADPKTGDGAGILIQIPHAHLSKECQKCGFNLPEKGSYGAGLVFLPKDRRAYKFCKGVFKKVVEEEGQAMLGWRKVPLDSSVIGVTARETAPVIEQVFIAKNVKIREDIEFERRLYVIRKRVENTMRSYALKDRFFFYITNLSARTLSYKGLLMPSQVEDFFLDLKKDEVASAICMAHSRYSTNTFPTWDLAQPFRFLAHNGEINTLRGNINWMRAREGLLESGLFGKSLKDLYPVIVPGGSDSAALDNIFELLTLSGRPIEHTMMMLIPAAWEQNKAMDRSLKDFYRYHTCLVEPWDGPAAIAFTDGARIGACLDRNGLRPARYIVTRDGRIVMASEVGTLKIDPADITLSGRIEPGKMLFIDTLSGRIIEDAEIKKEAAGRRPYGDWLKDNVRELDDIPARPEKPVKNTNLLAQLKAFGYTREDMKVILKPMAEKGAEPIGSMGNDTPHAVLSTKRQMLYGYFKQLFAQVTNPAIDPIREELVMSLGGFIGPEKNLLDETPGQCHRLHVKRPILTDDEISKIKDSRINGFNTRTVSLLFRADGNKKILLSALERVCDEAVKAIRDGYTFIVLSDRGLDSTHAAIPALLATGAVHHHLVNKALRTQIGIIVESAEPREVHHVALLFGYGADCVNPYLAYEAIGSLVEEGELRLNAETAVKNYIKALCKGILKILSKMGISTLQGYRGAQIFEALGIDKTVVDKCFAGTVSRIGGIGFNTILEECLARHAEAYSDNAGMEPYLAAGGVYQWKKDGEYHLWNPDSIPALQDAARNNDYNRYKDFANIINDQSRNPTTLRSLVKFAKTSTGPIPMEEVEPASRIVKRFATGAMSFGSISRAAHETIAIAMNRIGGKSNTGEGGEDPARFAARPDGDSARSAIKQVASGRFGVTTNYLVNADELQIKIAQGAKPGEGGQLPGHKVSEIIAKTRCTTPGVTLISPPPHHDIYSIEDLAQLIFDLKNVNPSARISVKLVSEIGVGTIAAGVAKGHADMILIAGGDGGTGASPLSSIRNAGLPWELGLAETHQTLVLNDLRSRVRLQADGQMRTGRDVAIAAMLGAEEFGFATAALIVLGCVMLRHCHLNNCSVGVATQDEELVKRFSGKSEHLVNYFYFVAEELREIMAGLGIRRLEDMVGRTELLEANRDILNKISPGLDLSRMLYRPKGVDGTETHCTKPQEHGICNVLDRELIRVCEDTIASGSRIKVERAIDNTDRTVGAMLSGELCKAHGENGLPDDTIRCKFRGTAGQSFGAFLAKGITFELEGMANDYVGKGISGGRVIIYPDRDALYKSDENIIIGNTTFYGAISGEAYIRGVAGERFCIRNSGISAVVEGVGDHGCEYMTGGRVAVIGHTGRNFGAGMSGGIAYVLDISGDFGQRCNAEMVDLEAMDKDDMVTVKKLLDNHYRYTKSPNAAAILGDFASQSKKFVKVMPKEYKRALLKLAAAENGEAVEYSDG